MRRDFFSMLAILALVSFVTTTWAQAAGAADDDAVRPLNVMLLTADDMGEKLE